MENGEHVPEEAAAAAIAQVPVFVSVHRVSNGPIHLNSSVPLAQVPTQPAAEGVLGKLVVYVIVITVPLRVVQLPVPPVMLAYSVVATPVQQFVSIVVGALGVQQGLHGLNKNDILKIFPRIPLDFPDFRSSYIVYYIFSHGCALIKYTKRKLDKVYVTKVRH